MSRLDALEERLARVEAKVDKLLDFRTWVLGAVAGISAVVSVIMGWLGGGGAR